MDKRGRNLNRFYSEGDRRDFKKEGRRGESRYLSPAGGDRRGRSLHLGISGRILSQDFDEDMERDRSLHRDRGSVERRHRDSRQREHYGRRNGQDRFYASTKMYGSPYAFPSRHVDSRERSGDERSNWIVHQMEASRDIELFPEYDEWMRDKGWVLDYHGDWERRNGGCWERMRHNEKYREWEIEKSLRSSRGRERYRHRDRNWKAKTLRGETSSEQYRHMDRNWNAKGGEDKIKAKLIPRPLSISPHESYGLCTERYLSPLKTSSPRITDGSPRKRFSEDDTTDTDHTSLRRSSSHNFSSEERSSITSSTSPNDRFWDWFYSVKNRSSLDEVNLFSNSIFCHENNSLVSFERKESPSQVDKDLPSIDKNYSNPIVKNIAPRSSNSNLSPSKITECNPRRETDLTSESHPRVKSEVKVVSTGRVSTSREKCCRIQRPCDYYNKLNECKYRHWHNDRSQCCRLHVCSFCFYQNYDLIRRGTPVLNLHSEQNCAGYIANKKEKQNRLRTRSLNRHHHSCISSVSPERIHSRIIDQESSRECLKSINKMRCKSLDRRFSINESKLDIVMTNMEVTIVNDTREDFLTKNILGPKDGSLKESTDSDDYLSTADNGESQEKTDDSNRSSEESDYGTDSSDDKIRINLLKPFTNSISDTNDDNDVFNELITRKSLAKINKNYLIESLTNTNVDNFKVHISGLGSVVTVGDIYNLFSPVGSIKQANLLGRDKAEVIFTSIDSALAAVEKLNNQSRDGNVLNFALTCPSQERKDKSKDENINIIMSECEKSLSRQSTPRKKLKSVIAGLNERIIEDKVERKTHTPKQSNDNTKARDKRMHKNRFDDDSIDLNVSHDLFKIDATSEPTSEFQLDSVLAKEKMEEMPGEDEVFKS